MFQTKGYLTASALALSLALAGCGGGSSSSTPAPTPTPTPAPTPTPTPTPAPTPAPAPTPTPTPTPAPTPAPAPTPTPTPTPAPAPTPTPSPATHSIGGNLSGLATNELVSVNLSGPTTGTTNTHVSTNGAFTLGGSVAEGARYSVSIATQPTGQTCSITNGSGTMGTADVTNVAVSCVNNPSTSTHAVGGSLTGLAQNAVIVVGFSKTTASTTSQITVPLSGNGLFTLDSSVVEGATYIATIAVQPSGQTCTVTNGSGTMGSSDVTNVGISCQGTTYSTVYSFQGGTTDGNNPQNRLVADTSGNLYGVTTNGGPNGTGVVFKLAPNGNGGYTESILHFFTTTATPPDGNNPNSTLLLDAASSTLYGTTENGGDNGSGMIFSIKTDGTGYTRIYSFSGSPTAPGATGYQPKGAIALDSAGYLYGTTYNGGSSGDDGVIYKVKTDGTGFTTLHVFTGNPDGATPQAGVTLDQATNSLYGTTNSGGQYGSGIIFKIQTDGTGYDSTFHQLSSAQGEGYTPYGALLLDNGVLYGTCVNGGSAGYGTVFSLGTDGTGFTVLHNFDATASDGNGPSAGVVMVNGMLYGTTMSGGTGSGNNKGTVFKLAPDGTGFTQLYSFQGYPDGSTPLAGLVQDPVSQALLGTTLSGGSGGTAGFGSVYKISP